MAAAAAFLLVVAGGLVTSHDAGLAVPDWPNTYGYNMFLYPLSRMTGGIYFEHAHRLLGSLVGLCTLALALVVGRADRRPAVRALIGGAVGLVILQGILGGLRVTGRFTLSTNAAELRPSLALAVVHGVTGQLFFALTVLVAAVTHPRWKAGAPPRRSHRASVEHRLGAVLVGLLAGQLLLGAFVRHEGRFVLAHVAVAMIVAAVALTAGARAWGLHPDERTLGRLGLLVIVLTGLQVLLGFAAFVVTQAGRSGPAPWYEVLFATAHQATGALLLAAASLLAAWGRRLLRPAGHS
ncbi:MAG: hypothetical protein D6718_12770 [Acidobacteria bacterium]|nr:MAG: hypothetical protein D6718_12770 [Acidobacteriota bacterium]